MKKIIFIELLHHHECLENPYNYFKDNGYEAKAILWEFVYRRLWSKVITDDECIILKQPKRQQFSSLSSYHKIWYIIGQFLENYKNIREIKRIILIEKPDSIYINTIESPFLIPLMVYLLRLKDIKIYLAIHNTNRLKVHFTKYFLFDFLIKKLIKKAYKVILLWEYLQFENNNTQNKVIYFNNRVKKQWNRNKSEKLSFVMSWHLDTTHKDIYSVLKGFWNLLNTHPAYRNNIELILLWQINNTVENWINMHNLTDVVRTFNHYVWEEDMDKYMSAAHYAIISTYKDSIYGKYKISWSYWDAVAYWVPIILSAYYAPEYQSNDIIRFKNDSLYITLEKLVIWK